MAALAFGTHLGNDWLHEVTNSGSVGVSDEGRVALCTGSGGAADRGYLRKYITVRGGEEITFRAAMRCIEGTGYIGIDYPGKANGVAYKYITNDNEWEIHEVKFTVPWTSDDDTQSVGLVVGVITNISGAVQVMKPQVNVSYGNNGALRAMAYGQIRFTSNGSSVTPFLSEDAIQSGIQSLVWTGSELTVTLGKVDSSLGTNVRMNPITLATIGTTNMPELNVKVVRYDDTTRQIGIAFDDGTGYVDLDTYMLATDSLQVAVAVLME